MNDSEAAKRVVNETKKRAPLFRRHSQQKTSMKSGILPLITRVTSSGSSSSEMCNTSFILGETVVAIIYFGTSRNTATSPD
jgi:hypothetical protein